jgi:hypothetical protein
MLVNALKRRRKTESHAWTAHLLEATALKAQGPELLLCSLSAIVDALQIVHILFVAQHEWHAAIHLTRIASYFGVANAPPTALKAEQRRA